MSTPEGYALNAACHGANCQSSPHFVGRMERLPKWLNLVPMVVQWICLSIRFGSWTLPSAANPAVTAGGLVGEGKAEYFRLMGSVALARTATFAFLRNVKSADSLSNAERAMKAAGLDYPVILKPDIGWCGFGVRIVRDPRELASYLDAYPENEDIVLQRFIPYEGEAGIYYVRWPGETRGRITGILLRTFPRVVGNGYSSVAELMGQHPRARRLGRDGRSEPCCDPSRIPAAGEQVRLSITGSTRVGGMYEDASALMTQDLEDAVDAVAVDMDRVHVARFDVRYETLGLMMKGQFQIMEVNGAGSEAVHAWDPRYSLAESYRIVFDKQRTIFAVGAAMRRLGNKPLGGIAMMKLYLRQARLIRHYPRSN